MPVISNSYNDYYALHHLALKYKVGDEESGLELLNRYAIFLQNYSKLFSTGTSDIANKSLRIFANYFNANNKQTHVLYSYRNNTIKLENMLSAFKLLKNIMTIQDFNQELILTLFQMAKTYKGKHPSFHTYMSRMFHYILLARLKKNLKNIYINSNILEQLECIDDEFDIESDMKLEDISNKIENNSHRLHTKYISIYDDKFINENWILGNFKNSLFADLSNSDRELIKYFYIDKLTDGQIAKKYGLCRATINRRRGKILNILKGRVYGQV